MAYIVLTALALTGIGSLVMPVREAERPRMLGSLGYYWLSAIIFVTAAWLAGIVMGPQT